MVEPASPTAGVDIRSGYALNLVVSVGIALEIAHVERQTLCRRSLSWMRHRDHDVALLVPLLDVPEGLG